MKESPPPFYAHVLKSALGLAGGLLLCGARSHAADTFFSLDDTNQDSKIVVVGNAGFVDSGGVTNSRYLKLTDATGQSAAVLFPDFEPGFIVASFTFECMIKCGDWYGNPPADGFSVNFARSSDPIIPLIAGGTNPGRGVAGSGQWNGSKDQGGTEIDLPEEGTQSGLAVGFDTWGAGNFTGGQNGTLDARGISIRVDGTFANFTSTFNGTTFPGQIAMPDVLFADGDKHDYEHDATTLITGPFSNGGDPNGPQVTIGGNTVAEFGNPNNADGSTAPPALGTNLAWVPLKLSIDQNGVLNVFWKNTQIVSNVQTAYYPSPGRIIFGASTGGAMEYVGIDSVHIVTAASTIAVIGNPAVLPDATGFSIVMNDSGQSVVNVTPANTTVQFDTNTITTWTSSKDANGATTITYHLPGSAVLASGSTHTVSVSTVDTNGTAITTGGAKPFTVFSYQTVDASRTVTGVDTTKSGFIVKPYQSFHGLYNRIDHYERVLAGESGRNMADLTQIGPDGNAVSANGTFTELNVIDYNVNGTPAQFPGLPSIILPDHVNDNSAMEFITYIKIPTTGFHTLGVNSDDGFRVFVGRNLHDRFQIDSVKLGEFDAAGGRGAADSLFQFYAKDPGIYPFRVVWENGGGGASCRFFSVESDGMHHTVNDGGDPLSLLAYSAGPISKRAYIAKIRPGVRSAPADAGTQSIISGLVLGEAGDPLVVTVVDGDTNHVVDGSVHLTVNGNDVTANTAVVKSGGTNTITWKPSGGLAFNVDYNCTLKYNEDTTPAGNLVTRTQDWNTFVWSEVIPLDLATNSFWIEAEDFDFNKGQSTNVASVMPYAGGAYAGFGGSYGIDFVNDDNLDSTAYRDFTAGDLSIKGKSVNVAANQGGRWGPTRPGGATVTANYKIGWIGAPDWNNYTRTIPAGTYTAYAAHSYDGDGFGQLHGRLALVTSGAGTANQTLQNLGFFDSRGSGGWSMNDVVSMQSPAGQHAYFKLPGGPVTLRYFADSGDFDWFTLVPASNVTPQVEAVHPAGGALVFENTPITFQVQDFTTTLNASSVKLAVNGTDVSAKVVANKVGDTTTLTYNPNPVLAPGAANYIISYADSAGTVSTVQVNFTVYPVDLTGLFLVEGEDFNYGGGKTLASASTMPYYGGAYDSATGIPRAVLGVDYYDFQGDDSVVYRLGLSAQTPKQNVNVTGNLGNRLGQTRGAWEMTSNYRIGWIGPSGTLANSNQWYNYTRTFPTGDYKVYAAQSYDGTDAHQLHGTLQLVSGDVTTTNQTTTNVGVFDAPGTHNVGGWGANDVVPMTDTPGGNVVTVHLSGTQTVRYQPTSGDYDYLAFVPSSPTIPRPTITIGLVSGKLTITYSGTLLSSPTANGTYTAVSGAVSPYPVPLTGKAQFYRSSIPSP